MDSAGPIFRRNAVILVDQSYSAQRHMPVVSDEVARLADTMEKSGDSVTVIGIQGSEAQLIKRGAALDPKDLEKFPDREHLAVGDAVKLLARQPAGWARTVVVIGSHIPMGYNNEFDKLHEGLKAGAENGVKVISVNVGYGDGLLHRQYKHGAWFEDPKGLATRTMAVLDEVVPPASPARARTQGELETLGAVTAPELGEATLSQAAEFYQKIQRKAGTQEATGFTTMLMLANQRQPDESPRAALRRAAELVFPAEKELTARFLGQSRSELPEDRAARLSQAYPEIPDKTILGLVILDEKFWHEADNGRFSRYPGLDALEKTLASLPANPRPEDVSRAVRGYVNASDLMGDQQRQLERSAELIFK